MQKSNPFQICLFIVTFACLQRSQAAETQFMGDAKEIEIFLTKTEGWPAKDQHQKDLLLHEQGGSSALTFTSKLECGSRVCATYLYEQTKSKRYQLIGRFDGPIEVLDQSHNEHLDLMVLTSIGDGPENRQETRYQFDGHSYKPAIGARNER